MGIYNSSRTRVQPVLGELLAKNKQDARWAIRLWSLPGLSSISPPPAAAGTLNPNLLSVNSVTGLPRAFEFPIQPPAAFLRWLLLHPEKMTVADAATFGTSTKSDAREMRRKLFSTDSGLRSAAQATALAELDRLGAAGSARKWWAFEGFTYVDCCLATDTLLLLVEGKRTEPVSSSTRWFGQRNQLWRNAEVASELAAGRAFGLLVAVEDGEEEIVRAAAQTMDRSLPHLSAAACDELSRHFLGAVTWAQIVTEFDLPTRLLREAAE
jgi:hypothetical protein